VALVAIIVAPAFRASAVLTGHPLAGDLLVFGELDALAAGALLSTYWYERRLGSVLSKARTVFAGTALILAALFASGLAFTSGFGSATDTLFTILLMPLVGGAASGFRGIAGMILEARPVRYVGKISYGIYVYHNFMPLLVPAIGRALGVEVPTMGVAAVATMTVASVGVAALSWIAIERPIALVKARFSAPSGRRT
jgi:peptidoglycan/LPS O-acetylase OafA/YrhL